MEDAIAMREDWIATFQEMKYHMKPEEATGAEVYGRQYGLEEQEEEDEYTEEDNGYNYRAVLPCGQVRNHCSFNAACNTQFQGTTAIGAKLAGWNLIYNGYGERLVNFVHASFSSVTV